MSAANIVELAHNQPAETEGDEQPKPAADAKPEGAKLVGAEHKPPADEANIEQAWASKKEPDPTMARTSHNGRQQEFELADGRIIALAPPPNAAFAKTHQPEVYGAIETLQNFITASNKIQGNSYLSESGKEHQTAPLAADAIQAMTRIHDTVAKRRAKLDKDEATLFAVPELQPNNAVQQLADSEARSWFRGLSADEKAEIMPKLIGGHFPKIAVALMRSPIPLTGSEKSVQDAWNASVEEANIGPLIDIRGERETLDWADMTISRAAEKLATAPGLNPYKVGAALRQMQADDKGPFKKVPYVSPFPSKS